MTDLYPTKTRRALLQDIADGLVVFDENGVAWRDERLAAFYDPFTATRTRVAARFQEVVAAGWATSGGRRQGSDEERRAVLTEAGRTVLSRSEVTQ